MNDKVQAYCEKHMECLTALDFENSTIDVWLQERDSSFKIIIGDTWEKIKHNIHCSWKRRPTSKWYSQYLILSIKRRIIQCIMQELYERNNNKKTNNKCNILSSKGASHYIYHTLKFHYYLYIYTHIHTNLIF